MEHFLDSQRPLKDEVRPAPPLRPCLPPGSCLPDPAAQHAQTSAAAPPHTPSHAPQVYALFKQHPELLVAEEEGLTKGGCAAAVCAWGCAPACCQLPRALPPSVHSPWPPLSFPSLPPACLPCRGAPRAGAALPAHHAGCGLLAPLLLCPRHLKVLLPGRAAVPGGPVAGEAGSRRCVAGASQSRLCDMCAARALARAPEWEVCECAAAE